MITLVPYLWGESTSDRAHYYPGALFVRGTHHWSGTLLPWCPICEGNPPLTGHITTLVPYLWGESTSDRAHYYPGALFVRGIHHCRAHYYPGALFVRGIHLWPGTLLPWCPICEGNPPLTGHITTLVPYLWGESTSDRAHYYPGALFVRGIHLWPGTLLPWCPICEENPPLTGHITTLVPYLWGESTTAGHITTLVPYLWGEFTTDRAHYYPGALFVRGIHHWPGTLLPWCSICEGNHHWPGTLLPWCPICERNHHWAGTLLPRCPICERNHHWPGTLLPRCPICERSHHWPGTLLPRCPICEGNPPLTGHITTPVPYLCGESTTDRAHYYPGALFVRGIHHCRAHYYPGALFVREIHHWRGKGSVMRKVCPCHDVMMMSCAQTIRAGTECVIIPQLKIPQTVKIRNKHEYGHKNGEKTAWTINIFVWSTVEVWYSKDKHLAYSKFSNVLVKSFTWFCWLLYNSVPLYPILFVHVL